MKEFIKNIKRAWEFVKDEKIRLIFYMIFNALMAGISILVPILSARTIVNLTESKFKQLLLISIALMFIEIFRNICNYFARRFAEVTYRETFTKIQTKLGSEILKIENKHIDEQGSGVFIQRLTSDTSRIAEVFNGLSIYLFEILTNIGIFVAVFIINKMAFIYMAISIIVMYLIENIGTTELSKKDKVSRKKYEKISSFIGELVRGSRDIKMLNAEKSFMKELESKVVDLNNYRYDWVKYERGYRLILGSVNDIFDTGLIFLLVFLIMNNQLNIANALVIHNYMSRGSQVIYYIGSLLEKVKDFNLSASRIFSIMDNKEFKKEKFGKKHLEKVEGNFEFKNVTFGYTEEAVLKNISFKVNANETVAFVGKSGTGKTTIFNLLCKMYDVNSGVITIDGIDIKKLDKDTIRGNITIISQNPYIFNMSIKDNLRLVKEDATDEEIKEACRMACLDEFIMELPNKYNTIVGEGGVTLSGGQRQRLAIARAFIQKTEIILFDEATSALDNETQAKIQQAIDNLKKDYTILIIAHRLSTVINSDRILFLQDGKIECEGTHKELLKKCKDYKLLYESELKGNK